MLFGRDVDHCEGEDRKGIRRGDSWLSLREDTRFLYLSTQRTGPTS